MAFPQDNCPKCKTELAQLLQSCSHRYRRASCPKCKTPMERGFTEYGQLCPKCLHYEDDPYWAMQGEFFDENGEMIPNPRADEVEAYETTKSEKA